MSIELPCFSQDNSLSAYELERLENIREIKKEVSMFVPSQIYLKYLVIACVFYDLAFNPNILNILKIT